MGTVAERLVTRILATTKVDGFAFFCGKRHRVQLGCLVRAITEGLILAETTAAPVICLSFLDFYNVGSQLWRRDRFTHTPFLLEYNNEIKTEP